MPFLGCSNTDSDGWEDVRLSRAGWGTLTWSSGRLIPLEKC